MPGVALLAYLVYHEAVGGQGLGWYTAALGAPVLAMFLAALPVVRGWIASRRRYARPGRARG